MRKLYERIDAKLLIRKYFCTCDCLILWYLLAETSPHGELIDLVSSQLPINHWDNHPILLMISFPLLQQFEPSRSACPSRIAGHSGAKHTCFFQRFHREQHFLQELDSTVNCWEIINNNDILWWYYLQKA